MHTRLFFQSDILNAGKRHQYTALPNILTSTRDVPSLSLLHERKRGNGWNLTDIATLRKSDNPIKILRRAGLKCRSCRRWFIIGRAYREHIAGCRFQDAGEG